MSDRSVLSMLHQVPRSLHQAATSGICYTQYITSGFTGKSMHILLPQELKIRVF